MPPSITILVPVYLNEKNLPTTIPKLLDILDRIPHITGKLVFVDDGSNDTSYSILQNAATEDSRIHVLRLSQNFGAHIALLAGCNYISSDCIAVIMADLQDPAELILEMVRMWQKGNKIIIAERIHRDDDVMTHFFAKIFWWTIRTFGNTKIPKGGFDFILFDKEVQKIICTSRKRNSHFMLQIIHTGFEFMTLPYIRMKRITGKSQWNFRKKTKLFIDSVYSFTMLPIYLIIMNCVLTFILGFNLLLIACTLILLGIYIQRFFEQKSTRPLYTISEKTN